MGYAYSSLVAVTPKPCAGSPGRRWKNMVNISDTGDPGEACGHLPDPICLVGGFRNECQVTQSHALLSKVRYRNIVLSCVRMPDLGNHR